MPIEKIEHLGIAVKNLEKSIELFTQLLGKSPYKTETVEHEKVKVAFFDVGGVKIELLEGLVEESPISKFVEKKGEGIHHLAFAVEEAQNAQEDLVKLGFEPLQETARSGADNKNVVFFHPKTTNGVLVELCSEKQNLK